MTKSAKKSVVLGLILAVLVVILVGGLWSKSSAPAKAQQVKSQRMPAPADLQFRLASASIKNGTPPYGANRFEVALTSTEGESRTCSISSIRVTYSDVQATYASFPKNKDGSYECRIWARTLAVKEEWDSLIVLHLPRPDPVDVVPIVIYPN